MTLLQAWPDAAQLDAKILATDIDPQMVAKARAGIYSPEETENLPKPLPAGWLGRSSDPDPKMEFGTDIKRLITFGELNLIKDWPFKGPFDAIFCRNVAIYFDQATQQTLWKRYSDYLRPGGYLFIGHSERVTGPALDSLSVVGVTSYRKSGEPDNKRAE